MKQLILFLLSLAVFALLVLIIVCFAFGFISVMFIPYVVSLIVLIIVLGFMYKCLDNQEYIISLLDDRRKKDNIRYFKEIEEEESE